jgi:hemerythrin
VNSQKNIHENLIKQVDEIINKIKPGADQDYFYLVKFLTDWVLIYVGDEDSRVGVFYRECRVNGE